MCVCLLLVHDGGLCGNTSLASKNEPTRACHLVGTARALWRHKKSHAEVVAATRCWYGGSTRKEQFLKACHAWGIGKVIIFDVVFIHYMGVFKNRGTPKWMVYKGKPY